jgi:hypothetical protein
VLVEGDFEANGYAVLRALVPPEIGQALLKQLWVDLREQRIPTIGCDPRMATKRSIEVRGHDYLPLSHFHWGMTPAMELASGAGLLPSYCHFRLYWGDDICRVHSDRPASQIACSLTLAYSDELPWALSIGTRRILAAVPIADDFGDEPTADVMLQPGDALLYRGVDYRHGRTTPNPNRWSAHLFMMWVERGSEHEGLAFEAVPPELDA